MLGNIYADNGFTPEKTPRLAFSKYSIALTAPISRRRLITSNRSHFEIVNGYRKLQLEIS